MTAVRKAEASLLAPESMMALVVAARALSKILLNVLSEALLIGYISSFVNHKTELTPCRYRYLL